jgi:hypothetical protein
MREAIICELILKNGSGRGRHLTSLAMWRVEDISNFDQGWSWPAALGARTIGSNPSNLVAFAFPSSPRSCKPMKLSPKASRMERNVRSQIRWLNLVASVLLMGCMLMTALFGWSLGRSMLEKSVIAVVLASIDLGGAVLMKCCGTSFAQREWAAVFGSAMGAIVCAVITFIGILGFQADNREAKVATDARAVQIADDLINYSKTTITQAVALKTKAGPNPSLVMAGIETLANAVNKQINMLKDGTIAVAPDGQARTLAQLTGLTEAQARSWATSALAGAFLFVQYVCQWLAGFMRHRIEPLVLALTSSGHTSSGATRFGAQFGKFAKFGIKFGKLSKDEARRDVIRILVAEESFPSNRELARCWRVSTTTVCHWLRDFRSEGHRIPPSPRGGRVGQRRSTPA